MEPLPIPATQHLPPDQILDVITHTARLSSNTEAIDPLLDTLRGITARSGGAFSPTDIRDLNAVQQQLEYHLVHTETIRSFDYESLHLHLKKYIEHGSSTLALNMQIISLCGIALLAGVGSALLLPLELSKESRSFLFVTAAYSTTYLGTAALFLGAIKNLTSQARIAYIYICISTVLISLTSILQPLTSILKLEDEPLMPSIIVAPLVPAYFVLYVGIRILGKLSGVQGRLIRMQFLFLLLGIFTAFALVVPSLVVPLTHNALPTPYVISVVLLQGSFTVMLAVSAAILARAQQHLTYQYIRAVRAFLIAIAVTAALNLYLIAYWILSGDLHPNPLLNIGAAGVVLGAVLYVRAAYMFNRMHRD